MKNLFERCLLRVIVDMARERYATDSDFARLAFPDAATPVNTWRSVRNGQNGTVRSVTIDELLNMARALDVELDELISRALAIYRVGWDRHNDVSTVRRNPGRPTGWRQSDGY